MDYLKSRLDKGWLATNGRGEAATSILGGTVFVEIFEQYFLPKLRVADKVIKGEQNCPS
jgi:hypothetical protein